MPHQITRSIENGIERVVCVPENRRFQTPILMQHGAEIAAMETRAAAMGSSPEKLPLFGWGEPQPHAGQDGQASSVAGFGSRLRPKKPVPSLL